MHTPQPYLPLPGAAPAKTKTQRLARRLCTALVLTLLAILLCKTLTSEAYADTPTNSDTSTPAANVNDPGLPALENTDHIDRITLREMGNNDIHRSGNGPLPPDRFSGPASLNANSQPRLSQSAWQLVQQSTRLEIPDNELVNFYREQYRREARWITQTLRRATPFIGHVVDELDKRYLPLELALLPTIESGYKPDAQSPANAAGIWQIMPPTAAEAGITLSRWFDGRSDIFQSTTAATDYLVYLNAEFHGDWLLTLAAYNAGLGRVRTAIKRNRRAGLPTDFWSLALPEETRQYVPKFLAKVATLRYDQPAELDIPMVPRGSAFDLVNVKQRMDMEQLSQLTDIPVADLRRLNAGLLQDITPPDGPHLVYVPQGVGAELVNRLGDIEPPSSLDDAGRHRVRAGDTLSSLAVRYGVTSQEIRRLNGLQSDIIRIGKSLRIPDGTSHGQRMEYVVSAGDTLSEIAERFSMRIADIRDSEGQMLADDIIYPGERLSVLTPTDAD